MKAVLMVVLCFILSCFDGFSQGYLPMLAEGRSWAVLQINGNDLSTYGTCIYKVGKDSLYGNAHYYPVYSGCDPNYQFMLEGFFREDTVEDKVYRKPFSDPTGDDFLVVWVFDHDWWNENLNNPKAYICLLGNDKIWDYELAALTNQINCNKEYINFKHFNN